MKQIPLVGRLGAGKVALVDDEDYEFLNQWTWHMNYSKNSVGYAVRESLKSNWTKTYPAIMHRIIMGVTDPKTLIDHKDQNGLNNCRSNLRIATASQNAANKRTYSESGFLGVSYKEVPSWDKNSKRRYWFATIKKNGKSKIIKHFNIDKMGSESAKIAAAKKYDEWAKEIHGEFANLNFKE